MKEIGYIRYSLSSDNENWQVIDRSCRKYGEPFSTQYEEYEYENEEVYQRFADLQLILHKPNIFNKKEYKNYWCYFKDVYLQIFPGDKLYLKIDWVKNTYPYSFTDLAKELSAEDFLEYLRDNGFGKKLYNFL